MKIFVGTNPPPDGTTVGFVSLDGTGSPIVQPATNLQAYYYFGHAIPNQSDPRFSAQWFTEIGLAPDQATADALLIKAVQTRQSGADSDLVLSLAYDCTVSSNNVRLIRGTPDKARTWRALVVDSCITQPFQKRQAAEIWLYPNTVDLGDLSMIDGKLTLRNKVPVNVSVLQTQIKSTTPAGTPPCP